MGREFLDVYLQIVEIAPEDLKKRLDKKLSCLATPELVWDILSRCVHECVIPSSSNDLAIKIYAILCDCSEEEMKSRFESDGL